MRHCLMTAAALLAATAIAEPFPEGATANPPTESVYVPSAFPEARRAIDRARLQEALAQAKARGAWMDERLRAAFAAKPSEHLGRVRVSKRRLLRVRAIQFAARYLQRDDATGFGFAERALKDAEE